MKHTTTSDSSLSRSDNPTDLTAANKLPATGLADRGGASPKKIAIGVIVLCLVGTAGGLAWHAAALPAQKNVATQRQAPVMTVTVAHPAMISIERRLSVHGSIAAWDPISVGATTSGLQITSILVDEGSLVHKGQVLARLDSDQLQAELSSEKAKLAAAVANVSKSIQPNRPEDINALAAEEAQASASVEDQEAALLQAQANLTNARANVKRYDILQKEGAVSTQEAENRNLTVQVTEALVRSAQKKVAAARFVLRQTNEHLSMARAGGRKEDVQIANANVKQFEANIQKLQTQISQTIIKAPVDGLISRRDAHLGDISTAGKPMFLITRDDRLEFRAQVPESDLHLINAGQSVDVYSALGAPGTVNGRVREISPLVDQDTRLATARIDLPKGSKLKAGMYAEARINLGNQLALTVPSQAVLNRDEKHSVFILHGDIVESKQVTIGNRSGDLIEIISGLGPQDSVVIEGAGFLKDGDCVAIAR